MQNSHKCGQRRAWYAPWVVAGALLSASTPLLAGGKISLDETKWISIGAGLRAAFTSVEDASPSGDNRSNDFDRQNTRLYINGQVHEDFKFTFNTEEIDDDIDVLDAIIQYEPSDAFNIWFGRMLTPADRIEMNGPFYALSWNQYTVPLFPSDQGGEAGRIGRDDGITVWGNLDKFQYAVGVFDGFNGPANDDDNPLFAARFAYNFLNKENNPAYYTSSTYYGTGGDIFTLALSLQHQTDGTGIEGDATDFTGYVVDFLSETVLDSQGVVAVEGEYKVFDASLSTAARASDDCFCLFDGEAYFATAGYLFPQAVGPGKFQPYVRYTSNEPDGYADDSDLTEIGLNYVIQGHNLRFNLNFTDGDANASGEPGDDGNAFLAGVQLQI